MASEIKVDTISEKTSAGGVTIDGLLIKDGGISGDVSLIGTTPTFTIGDAGAEDAALVFDGNAQDFYIALDDSADDLVIGLGNTLVTTPAKRRFLPLILLRLLSIARFPLQKF